LARSHWRLVVGMGGRVEEVEREVKEVEKRKERKNATEKSSHRGHRGRAQSSRRVSDQVNVFRVAAEVEVLRASLSDALRMTTCFGVLG